LWAWGAADKGLLSPGLWLNPYDDFANTYQDVPDSGTAYNAMVFDGEGLAINANIETFPYLGARYYQQVPTGSTVTVVVDKDEPCDNHYVAFSTSPNPTRFAWGPASDRVMYTLFRGSSGNDQLALLSTSSYSSTYCNNLGVRTWNLTLTATTAYWTDSICGTLTEGKSPLP
jgi:hypothetical protein